MDRDAFDRIQSGRPAWQHPNAAAGWDFFEKLDMPSEQEEVWRYVELDLDLADFSLVDEPALPDVVDLVENASGIARVVDGHVPTVDHDGSATFVATTSAEAASPESLSVLKQTYGSAIPVDLDIFSAAHHAFTHDGVFLFVPKGQAIGDPYYVDLQAVAEAGATFPRITVVVEDAGEASLVVHCASPQVGRRLVVPQLEVVAGVGARVSVGVVQRWGYDTTGIFQVRLVAQRDATVRFTEVGLGGDLSRVHLVTDLIGRGSSAQIVGAYFGDAEQTLDYRYFMNHAAPNTTSEMFLKGAVEDEALSVFTGMIRIEPAAQRTNAHQTNRNLILSEGAAAQSVPNLEILANDVRCGHGSTVGPLDYEQRYYLMSRGLDQKRADRLQVRGFFQEAISRIPHRQIREPVGGWINDKFIRAQEEGRV